MQSQLFGFFLKFLLVTPRLRPLFLYLPLARCALSLGQYLCTEAVGPNRESYLSLPAEFSEPLQTRQCLPVRAKTMQCCDETHSQQQIRSSGVHVFSQYRVQLLLRQI